MIKSDCIVQTYTNSSPIVSIRITHMPTGLYVEYTGLNRHREKEKLYRQLEDMVDKKENVFI